MKRFSIFIYQHEFFLFSSLLLVIIIIFNSTLTIILNKKVEPTNLIIISHPSDELIFAGSHLLNDNYLVVCITCSKKDQDFINLINYTKDSYKLLNYSEDLSSNYDNIKNELDNIINSKKWNQIITHNPEGEYGHPDHKITSEIVTSLTNNNLYYFGKYYSPNTIREYYFKLTPIDNLNEKYYLLSFYSNKELQTEFSHLFNYEEWTPSSKRGDLS